MMIDQVKYQLEKADFALREALKFGGAELSPYRLGNIVDALKEIDNAKFSLVAESLDQVNIDTTFSDGLDNTDPDNNAKWKKYGEMNNTPFLWDNKTEFVPAVSE